MTNDPCQMTETDAVARPKKTYLRQRDREFEEEAVIHIDALFGIAVQMTRNTRDAEDLIQETYLKAFRFFGSFRQGTNCKAWLFSIMRNTFINNYRKIKKAPEEVEYDKISPFYESIKDNGFQTGFTPEDHFFTDILDAEVQKALDGLPDEFRLTVVLADLEGFSYKEIADILGCPLGTVRSRLSRGRKQLQTNLYTYAKNKHFIRN